MCGLAGFLELGGNASTGQLQGIAAAMADRLAHRGPDAAGTWVDASAGIALGHRRLAIRDLSAQGGQPMLSACGRYVLVHNGEIYNCDPLRQALEREGACRWRGHSDTEIMLAAISHWGLEAALARLNGMFAFALWDRAKTTLYLVRDRLGEKPLYYGWMGNTLLFASELKALHAHPAWRGEIDRDSVAQLLRLGYIPAPTSIFRGVHKLLPGTLLEISRAADAVPRPYWTLDEVARNGMASPFRGDAGEAAAQLEKLLRQSVRQQMVADVPLGIFLSGGVDSSLVAALAQAEGNAPVRTFSIGFAEAAYDEAHHARQVARHLGSEHAELRVTPEHALALIPDLPDIYDEPFADPAQIPACLLARFARQQVVTCLSGDGGDELFGGYDRYLWGTRAWALGRHLPYSVRKSASGLLAAVPGRLWDALGTVLPPRQRYFLSGARLHKLARILAAEHPDEVYLRLVERWDGVAEMVPGAGEMPLSPASCAWGDETGDMVQRMMLRDSMGFLPDDVLAKVDRATMAVGLESRAPFLDHRIAEFAWHLPLDMKIRQGQNKWLLRQVLYRHVPEKLVERPKMGFAVPLDDWLRGPLREWAEHLLDERSLRQAGLLYPLVVRRKWQEHLSGKRHWQHGLWSVLMLQAWLEKWGKR